MIPLESLLMSMVAQDKYNCTSTWYLFVRRSYLYNYIQYCQYQHQALSSLLGVFNRVVSFESFRVSTFPTTGFYYERCVGVVQWSLLLLSP